MTSRRALAWVMGVAFGAFVVVRLGSALVGARVFLGLEWFRNYVPWSAGAPARSTTSTYVADHLDFFIPGLNEIWVRLWAGDVAGWSSYVGGGSSLLGTPIFGVLSPGRWTFLVLPPWLAPAWSKLFELAFAALFVYLLVRRLKGSRLAAALAAFVYPTTGFMIAWTNWPQTAVGSVLPMVFWSIERFVQERRAVTLAPVSVAVALLLFGGFPAVAGQTLYVAGAYAVTRLAVAHRHRLVGALSGVAQLGGALAVGLGLTAVQLVPFAYQFLETVDLSYREGGFFLTNRKLFLLTSMFPGSFAGNGLDIFPGGNNPVEMNTYVGAVVGMLALIGLTRLVGPGGTRAAPAFFGAVVGGVVVLIWFQGFWTSWLSGLPIFDGNPISRWRAQLGLPVAVLAAFGLDRLLTLRQAPSPRVRWAGSGALVASIGVVAGLGVFLTGVDGLTDSVVRDVWLTVVPFAVVAVLVAVSLHRPRVRVVTAGVAVVVVVGQAIVATGFYWPTGERSDFYRTTATHEYLQRNLGHDRIATTKSPPLKPNTTAVYGIRTLNGHSFYPAEMRDLIRAIDPGSFVLPTYSFFSVQVSPVINSPGLNRLGVRYLLAGVGSPILGTVQPLPTGGTPVTVAEGSTVQQSLPPGPLRGLQIGVDRTSTATAVTVEVVSATDGTTILTTKVRLQAGSGVIRVPLALETTPPSGPLTVRITPVDGNLLLSADADGELRLAAIRPPAQPDRIRLVYAAEGVTIWERLDYLPRIRWAGAVTVVPDPDAAKVLAAEGASQSGTVILDRPPPAGFVDHADVGADVSVEEDSGDTISVEVTAAQPGYVVVADSIGKDFAAVVDGRSAPIVRADYAVAAVYVEAGRHTVTLSYAPRGRTLGLVVTGLSAVALAGMWLLPGYVGARRRRDRSAQTGATGG